MHGQRLTRLFHILGYLSPHSQVTVRELAREYNVTKRTIERDIEALQDAHLGVFYEDDRIKISRIGYKKIKSWMSG